MRKQLQLGRWRETMPGRDELVKALGVSGKTVELALDLLEKEGLLVSQGPGRRRRISLPEAPLASSSMNIAILLSDPVDRKLDYMVELQHELFDAGHSASFAPKTLEDLGTNVERVRRLVDETMADAWVVVGGSRAVLEWFAERPFPTFALFGRRGGLPITGGGPDKIPIVIEIVHRFIDLGHQRIVLLVRPRRRLPVPGTAELTFLNELAAHGIETGSYNLPNWEETPESYHACLDSLFGVTPPTAMIIDEAPFFTAAMQFLARRGIRIPEDVSLVCTDPDPTFEWCIPAIAHIHWDPRPLRRRIVRWATNVSRGKRDVRQYSIPSKFIPGGTIGPAPRR